MTHIISSSLDISGSLQATSFTGDGTNILNVQTASFASTASYALTSQGGGGGFPHTGSAIISGSLTITGSLNLKGLATGSGVTQNLVLDNGEVKIQGIDEGTSGGIQPTVQTFTTSSGIINLDTTQYNGFDITPSDDTTVNFNVGSNKFYNFDLLWTNKKVGGEELDHFNLQSGSHSGFFYTDDEFRGSYDGLYGIYFTNNGLTAYTLFDQPQETVVEYTLQHPYTLDNTATQTGKTLDISNEVSTPMGFQFSSDGTKCYTLTLGQRIYQYNLGTAYDISTATYSGNNYRLDTSNSTYNFFLSPDDSKIWWADVTSIRQVQLTTPGDISSATDTGVSFDLTGQASSVYSFTFNSDGTSFIANNDGLEEKFYKYNLSTPYDITTAVYDSDSGTLDYTVHGTNPFNIRPSHDDKLLIMVESTQNPPHVEYFDISDPAPFNIAKTEYNGINYSVSSQESIPTAITFNNDGSKLYLVGDADAAVHQYSLSSAYDISTMSYDSVFAPLGSQDDATYHIEFNNDGTKFYMVGFQTDIIHQYTAGTPFDVSTLTYDNVTLNTKALSNDVSSFRFNNDGTRLFVNGYTAQTIFQYNLGTAFDINTATYSGTSFNRQPFYSTGHDFTISSNGTKLYGFDTINKKILQFTLPTPFDLTQVYYDNVIYDVSSQDNVPFGIEISPDGTKLYVVGSNTDKIYQYDIFDGILNPDATLTLPGTITWSGGSAPTLSSENQKDWFRFESVDNGTSWLGEIKRQGF